MQGHGDEKLYLIAEGAALQRGICQKTERCIQFRSPWFKSQNHFLQGLGVNAATGYPVEVNFFSQAVGTGVVWQCVSAGIFATAWAVVGGGAGKELVPAIAAKIAICFSYTCTAGKLHQPTMVSVFINYPLIITNVYWCDWTLLDIFLVIGYLSVIALGTSFKIRLQVSYCAYLSFTLIFNTYTRQIRYILSIPIFKLLSIRELEMCLKSSLISDMIRSERNTLRNTIAGQLGSLMHKVKLRKHFLLCYHLAKSIYVPIYSSRAASYLQGYVEKD